MRTHRFDVLIVALLVVVVLVAKDRFIGDARWWNLVMAGLLLVLLARYLWRERSSRR